MSTTVAISYFKAHCLEILDTLHKNQQPIIITKRDRPIAKVTAIGIEKPSIFGIFKNKGEIKGDIVESMDVI